MPPSTSTTADGVSVLVVVFLGLTLFGLAGQPPQCPLCSHVSEDICMYLLVLEVLVIVVALAAQIATLIEDELTRNNKPHPKKPHSHIFPEMTIYTNIIFLQMMRLCHFVIIIYIKLTP
jgi:hypothetical protein